VTGTRIVLVSCLVVSCISAFDELAPDQLALLQDSGGWEYISMNDSQNGFPTQHVCFDGHPHPDTCSGKLTLTGSNTFVQQVAINHQTVSRRGTYELDGSQLAFFDEFGTRDGPYTIAVDTVSKFMTMDMPQVKVKLQLYKEYRKQLDKLRHKRPAANSSSKP
jgi:hypothetical protein